MTIIKIKGLLEIDPERGVIYFHEDATGFTKLRICRLPTPIPDPKGFHGEPLDITSGFGVSWTGLASEPPLGRLATPSEVESAAPRCNAHSLTTHGGKSLICVYLPDHIGFHSWMPLLTIEERNYERERNSNYFGNHPESETTVPADDRRCEFVVDVPGGGQLRCHCVKGHHDRHVMDL